MERTYRSIFISDIHLGSRGCKADLLCDFLKNNTADNLYLVGDIIDGWRLKKKWYWPQSHSNVIRRILTAAKRGTTVHYIIGNHDEALRNWMHWVPVLGNVEISNRRDHIGVDGRRYLVVHGDMFDSLMQVSSGKWLMHIGDKLYDIIIDLNDIWAKFRSRMGLSYWSMSRWIKHHTKQAVSYVLSFEKLLADYCHKKGYNGIICGHIHTAEIRDIDGVTYMNDGDWVESCTALVEHWDGQWEIITWTGANRGVDTDSDSGEHQRSPRSTSTNEVWIRN
jgi:UDP-2,3-diacylglucosamine pyrophosphatase LpxH